MTAPFQAGAGVGSGTVTSRTYPISVPTAAGDTLIVIIDVNNTTLTISSVTDDAGNIYTPDENYSTATPTLLAYRSPGASGGSGGGPTGALSTSQNFTINTSATSGNVEAFMIDVPGVGDVDQIVAIVTGNDGSPTIALTPTQDNETIVVYGTWKQTGGAGTWGGSLTGFAGEQTGSNAYVVGAYEVLGIGTANVAISPGASITSTNWRLGAYSFKSGGSSPSFSGTGTAALSLSTSATGSKQSASTGTAPLSLGTSASGSVGPNGGIGTAPLTLATATSGTSVRSGTATASLGLSTSASGASSRSATASSALTLGTAATGQAPSASVYFMLGGVVFT